MGSRQMVLLEGLHLALPLPDPLGPNALGQAQYVLRADFLRRQFIEIVRGLRKGIPSALADDFPQQGRRVALTTCS